MILPLVESSIAAMKQLRPGHRSGSSGSLLSKYRASFLYCQCMLLAPLDPSLYSISRPFTAMTQSSILLMRSPTSLFLTSRVIVIAFVLCFYKYNCLSCCLSIYLPLSLSVCLSVSLSHCLSVCLSVCLSICLSVCLSVFCTVPSSRPKSATRKLRTLIVDDVKGNRKMLRHTLEKVQQHTDRS